MTQTSTIKLSNLDEQRFGIKTIKTVVENEKHLNDILISAQEGNVPFVIARINSKQLDLLQKAEAEGFCLMDTLMYYEHDLNDIAIDVNQIQLITTNQAHAARVKEIAALAFHNYNGHYHADPQLDNKLCDEVYISWAESMCLSDNPNDYGLCSTTNEGQITGFAALRRISNKQGDGVLFAVSPEYQRQGMYYALIIGALNYFKKIGCARMTFSTQITNIVAQKAWVKLGFQPTHSMYTLHKWCNV